MSGTMNIPGCEICGGRSTMLVKTADGLRWFCDSHPCEPQDCDLSGGDKEPSDTKHTSNQCEGS